MKINFTILLFLFFSFSVIGQLEFYKCDNTNSAECLQLSGGSYSQNYGCPCNAICSGTDLFSSCESSFRVHIFAHQLKFIAPGESIQVDGFELDFNPGQCGFTTEGFYLGLMEDCEDNCLISNSNCGSPTDAVSFSYSGLIPGLSLIHI